MELELFRVSHIAEDTCLGLLSDFYSDLVDTERNVCPIIKDDLHAGLVEGCSASNSK